MEKYVLVDADLHEIYVNEFGGDIPPMSVQELCHYFNCGFKEIPKKAGVKLYKVHDDKRCPHCGAGLCDSKIDGYKYQCFYCDEDFCEIETLGPKPCRYTLAKTILDIIEDECEKYGDSYALDSVAVLCEKIISVGEKK